METLTEKFIEKAKIIHGSRYDYSFVEYVNAKTKVTIICKAHGAFQQTPDKHVNGRCGCPVCAGNVAYDTKGFVKRAKAVHGDRYDYPSRQNGRTGLLIRLCRNIGSV